MFESYAETLNESNNYSMAVDKFVNLVSILQDKDMLNQQHGDVEKMLHKEGFELLRLMLQAHFDTRCDLEKLHKGIKGGDGVLRTHRRKHVQRKLSTLFGEVEVKRVGYSSKCADVVYPMDMSLNLGPSKYSDGLCQRVAEEASKSSFDECVKSVRMSTGGHTYLW